MKKMGIIGDLITDLGLEFVLEEIVSWLRKSDDSAKRQLGIDIEKSLDAYKKRKK